MPVKEGSGRRYWVRANPTPKASGAGGATKKKPKARFLEPYHLSDERRAELMAMLTAGGIGDAEGRGLFAAAIEYDIAAYRQSAPKERAPKPAMPKVLEVAPEPDPALEAEIALVDLLHALGGSIASLVQGLAALEPAARERLVVQLKLGDPFRRDYAGEYLDVLGSELTRVAEAARSVSRPAPPPPPPPCEPPEPPLGEGARAFLRRVARVYEECLEARASPDPDGAFRGVLDLVGAEAGIHLPADPESLTSILQGG
jgi:hypothetical protein